MSALVFLCAVIAVHDADGPLWCASGEKVRLQGVAARELDGSCRPNQPCPVGSPITARTAAIVALGGRVDAQKTARLARYERGVLQHVYLAPPHVRLSCTRTGTSRGRVTAWCQLPSGRDLSCEAIRAGAAVRWAKFDREGKLTRCRA